MTIDLTKLAHTRMVLATDLDGTFLGGSDADRDRLYDWLRAHAQTVGLVFVTGRDPAFIADLCGAGRMPWPSYVVGDVGTTIAHVDSRRRITPIPALEQDIATLWGGSAHRCAVRSTMSRDCRCRTRRSATASAMTWTRRRSMTAL